MTASDFAYGSFCAECGMMGGSSKNEDFRDEIMEDAVEHLRANPNHAVHVKIVPRSFV